MNVIELNRRELELQVTESALHVEAERLTAWANELKSRQSKMPKGLRPAVPTEAIHELEARSEKARASALETRELVTAKLRNMLENTASTLQKLEDGLKTRSETSTPPGLRAVSNSPKDLGLAAHVLSSMPTRDASLAGSLADSLAAMGDQDEPMSSAPAASVLVLPSAPVAQKVAAPAPTPPVAQAPVVRLSPRVKMSAQVDFGSESNFYQGFSANISEGGLFVTTLKLLPLGTEVDLAFSLPSGERISTRGVVRWIREANDASPDMTDGMGLQFMGLEPDDRVAIERFVEQRDPLFFAA